MFDPDTRKSYSVTSAILGWLVFFSFTITLGITLSWVLGDDAAGSSNLHMSLGIVSCFFVTLRLLWWLRNKRPQTPKSMPAMAFSLSRTTSFLLYLSIFCLTVSGLMNGWALGYSINMFGVFTLPVLQDLTVSMAGQVHKLSLMITAAMLSLYIVVNAFLAIRYKVGLRRMLPGLHL